MVNVNGMYHYFDTRDVNIGDPYTHIRSTEQTCDYGPQPGKKIYHHYDTQGLRAIHLWGFEYRPQTWVEEEKEDKEEEEGEEEVEVEVEVHGTTDTQ